MIKVPCPQDSPACVDTGVQGGTFCVRTDCTTPETVATCSGSLIQQCMADGLHAVRDCSLAGPNVYCSADEQYNIPCTVNEAAQPCRYQDPVCDCDDFVVCDPKRDTDTRFHCPEYGYRTCGDTRLDLDGIQPGCLN